MLESLIKSSVRRKVLGLFALNPEARLYARQVALELDESPYAVGKELHQLRDSQILQELRNGKRCVYQWNGRDPGTAPLRQFLEERREAGQAELQDIPDLKRRQRLQKSLGRFLDDLKKYYDPKKVIIFGSMASGRVHPGSDIDMVILKETKLPYFERVEQIVDLIACDVDIDFLVYTPEEFKRAVRERPFFQEEIIKKGRVIYEKTT